MQTTLRQQQSDRLRQYDVAMALLIRARALWVSLEAPGYGNRAPSLALAALALAECFAQAKQARSVEWEDVQALVPTPHPQHQDIQKPKKSRVRALQVFESQLWA